MAVVLMERQVSVFDLRVLGVLHERENDLIEHPVKISVVEVNVIFVHRVFARNLTYSTHVSRPTVHDLY